MRRFFLLLLITLYLGSASPAFAQLSPLCWTKEACVSKRTSEQVFGATGEDAAEAGFIRTSETIKACGDKNAAGKELGYCLPVGQTQTTISFGGKKQFLHMGDAIQSIYQYAIVAAGILAVIMVIVAGFIWTTSGGNAERIGAAKKRIGGAIAGLLLAVLSYTILNTLNPALVNLRLPQIWMVNTERLTPPLCTSIDSASANLAAFAQSGDGLQTKQAKLQNKLKEGQTKKIFDTEPKRALCGSDYIVADTNGQTCRGTVCDPLSGRIRVCAYSPATNLHSCEPGNLTGKIVLDDFIEEAKTLIPGAGILTTAVDTGIGFINDYELVTVCCNDTEKKCRIAKNKDMEGGSKEHLSTPPTIYYRTSLTESYIDSEAKSASCETNESFAGFLMSYEIAIAWDFWDRVRFVDKHGYDIKTRAYNSGTLSNVAKQLIAKTKAAEKQALSDWPEFIKLGVEIGKWLSGYDLAKKRSTALLTILADNYLYEHTDDLISPDEFKAGLVLDIALSEAIPTINMEILSE